MSSSKNTRFGLIDGWFHEKDDMWPGQQFCLQVDKVLLDINSKYQHIEVFESKTYGRVLVLDGVLQLTERDECSYQEMISHVPLFALKKAAQRVLIIGGGDGAVLSQVLQHKSVKEVTLCDIDGGVIEAARTFFPRFSKAFSDDRSTVCVMDGAKFLQQCVDEKRKFDAVIVDSSDPDGPASTLFGENFYKTIAQCLSEDGVLCAQGECFWLHLELIQPMLKMAKKYFKTVQYASTSVPTYPCGQIGFFICAPSLTSCATPARQPTTETLIDPDAIKFYTPEMHTASFVLPKFVKQKLEK
mmetsp:Transcript_9216/g.13948  ORF Transcript_9216/g.13948 Transcript_9216/m.13948 type:complete len:300 (-) Transcript_9216:888-1787(-)